jgi:hypothetical protein
MQDLRSAKAKMRDLSLPVNVTVRLSRRLLMNHDLSFQIIA